ncbi:hypothetical protein [Streptomyces sp. NPDC097619]|uniref:hypothetical protein n=1 Tax=Streptomyces sp. NPDC097619 TaxID=3157228 RepID=UPI00331C0428
MGTTPDGTGHPAAATIGPRPPGDPGPDTEVRRPHRRRRSASAGALIGAGLLYGLAKGVGTVIGERTTSWALTHLPPEVTTSLSTWLTAWP